MAGFTTTAPITQSPVAIPIADRPELDALSIFRFSVDEYHVMIEQGFFQDSSVELLEGLVVKKMGKNRPHTLMTRKLRALLEAIIGAQYYVDSQEPLIAQQSEPEPDALIVRGRPEDYPDEQPGFDKVPFVAEVAASTLARDRGIKKRIYARAGIPVYWIVNLDERQIEVYTRPSGPTPTPSYAESTIYKAGDEVQVVIDGQEVGKIAAKELLP